MPIHDWTRVAPHVWHDFHVGWVAKLYGWLNRVGLPKEFYAGIEFGGTEVGPGELGDYARRRRTVVVRTVKGDKTVALLEVLSPGTKVAGLPFDSFVWKVNDWLDRGVNVSVVDLFPATSDDTRGTHARIWAVADPYTPALPRPESRPLTVAAYVAFPELTAYVEATRVGEPAPDVPLFLAPDRYVSVALEATYTDAFSGIAGHTQRFLSE